LDQSNSLIAPESAGLLNVLSMLSHLIQSGSIANDHARLVSRQPTFHTRV
jgi:hypothetical protein